MCWNTSHGLQGNCWSVQKSSWDGNETSFTIESPITTVKKVDCEVGRMMAGGESRVSILNRFSSRSWGCDRKDRIMLLLSALPVSHSHTFQWKVFHIYFLMSFSEQRSGLSFYSVWCGLQADFLGVFGKGIFFNQVLMFYIFLDASITVMLILITLRFLPFVLDSNTLSTPG